METSSPAPHVLQTQRILPYAPDAVYAAFADPDRLAKWWGPNGFTNTFTVFEFRPGGRWTFVMHGPDGTDYPNDSVFAELDPGRKVVIEHVCPPYFTLTVSLQPVGKGTRVLWVQAFENAGVAEAVRAVAGPGNEQNLDRLGGVLGGAG